MKPKSKVTPLENVKLKSALVAALREKKKQTGIPISILIEQAVQKTHKIFIK